jgi:hypothetical protein
LRQVELIRRGVLQHGAYRRAHQGMHDEIASGDGARDQRARAPGPPPGEVVGTERRRLEKRLDLVAHLILTAGSTSRSTTAQPASRRAAATSVAVVCWAVAE